jgi:hypothetical protein
MDLRTGKLLYAYPSQTSTAHTLLPLAPLSEYTFKKSYSRFSKNAEERRDRVGLVTLSSDATLRACSTTAPPEESKKNVTRGEVLGMVGGVGSGGFGYYGSSEMEELEGDAQEEVVGKGEDVGGAGDGDEEEVWDDMAVVEEDEGLGSDMDEEDDEESSEDEAPPKKRNGGKR